jgi:hypothetical protein
MLKNNRIQKIVTLLAIMFFAGILSAQQADEIEKRALEREIKVSGNYLYGEAVGNTKEEAVKMAKSVLMSEINKETLNHPEWQFAKSIQAKDVEYNTDMIDLMRGNKFRVIAYIKKNDIQVVFDNKTPEIKIEDKKVQQGKTQANAQSAKVQPVAEQKVTPAPIVEKMQPKTDETKTPVHTVDNSNVGGLLGQILNTPSMRDIQKTLIENKKIGKVAYGAMDKLTAPEKAYIIVYKKTGEVVAILDKGNVSNRKDLLSGKIIGNEIVQQNQVIWFQIF